MACLDISPLGENVTFSPIVAVGLWSDISACILQIPDLVEAYKENLGGGIKVRIISTSKKTNGFFLFKK